jgi:hypothetical protein
VKGWPALVFLCACGIDETGLVVGGSDASSAESASADVNQAENAVDAPAESAPPQACSLDAGACVATLPAGWDLVAFDPSSENTCPSNYTSAPVVWNVSANPSACDCGCTVNKTPACDVGAVQRFVSTDNSCSMSGVTLNVNGAGCMAYPQSNTLSAYAKSTPLAPSGGTCTGDVIQNKANFGVNHGPTCKVPPACQEQFCGGDVPGGFELCVEHLGQQACPAGWSTPILAGDDFTFQCTSCSCDVNGASTCTNASLDIFSDSQCTSTKKLVTMPVDGNCDADAAQGFQPIAFEYHSTLTQNCNATGAKTASNIQLVNARTICCK